MKTKILSILMVLVISVMAIPSLVLSDSGGGDGGQSVDGTLILDNKNTTTWQRIADGKYGIFTYNSSGDKLNWSLAVAGLDVETSYSLIYFANPYPGNNPGALIWTQTSGADGRIDVAARSDDLGMDLPTAPDSNMLVDHSVAPDLYAHPYGAKIWLIPSAYYVGGQVTTWNSTVAASILFETDLITYVDTNKSGGSITGLTTIVTEPVAKLSFAVTPTNIPFGAVAIGDCSPSGANIITISNDGNVPIIVTGIPSAGFYATSLKLGDIGAEILAPTGGWKTTEIIPAGFATFSAVVCPLPGLSGTQTGSLTFMAEYAAP